MKEGDVVVLPMRLSDGSLRTRPAIVLKELPAFRDVLVCGVSTQLRQAVQGFDELIGSSDADFPGSGLRADSLIRLGFLQSVPRKTIAGAIGAVSPERHRRLLTTLSNYLVR